MAQITALADRVVELAEMHEQIVLEAIEDGWVTPQERYEIIHSARRLRLAHDYQAKRNRLVIRMMRGGHIHRSLILDIRDYDELVAEENAASVYETLAA